MSSIISLLMTTVLGAGLAGGPEDYYKITIVDEQTGRGVPLVELTTVNAVSYYTDSNGIVAFYEPGLMDKNVHFKIKSHGYEYPADGFGIRGKALKTTPGGEARLEIKRINVAERIYRITGAGIYRDTVMVGEKPPLEHPVLNGKVMGQDSVFTIIYQDRIWWFWGDTGKPEYPLGNFHMSGATSRLPADGGLDPEVGVNLDYFVDENGFSKAMAPMAGDGPTWADAFVVLTDKQGRDRMYGAYSKIVPANMATHDRGLMVLNDEKKVFEKIETIPLDAPIQPRGHVLRHQVNGEDYLYFTAPYPLTRTPATLQAYRDFSAYEAFTCLKPGSDRESMAVDRDEQGQVRYAWKRNTDVVGSGEQAKLIESGALQPEEALLQLRDITSGDPIQAHSASVYWNPYRQRFVMVTCQIYGTSMLGEVWYTEGDTPLGPWVYARKIFTHDQYSYYNTKQHPMLDKDGGRVIFIDGTYTHSFSGNPEQTPRYDYNQIMYKLDLADERVILPVPVYEVTAADDDTVRLATRERLIEDLTPERVVFFAPDRPAAGSIPIYQRQNAEGAYELSAEPGDASAGVPDKIAFYALPADREDPPPGTSLLYAFVDHQGRNTIYTTSEAARVPDGYQRADQPIARVWMNPLSEELSKVMTAEIQPHPER